MAKIEGRNPVIEAIRGNRRIDKILLQRDISGEKIDWIIEQAQKENILVERVSKNQLDNIASSHSHQGIIAFAEPVRLVSPREIVDYSRERNEDPLIIILDQIQDPHNFGSIIRTAYTAGAHGIIFQDKRAASITPVVVKSSAGAIEHILMSEVTNINKAIEDLKELGLWIAGADIQGEQSLFEVDLTGPLGIVIGSEGEGLRRLVREKCDFLVKIPMKGRLGSLNASVAGAIIIYEVLRQRMS